MAFLRLVPAAGRFLPRVTAAASRVLPRAGTATRTAAGVLAGAAVADAALIPAAERVTGRDLPGGTVVRDAAAGAAESIGQVLGAAEAGASRGIAEGALQGLLPDVGDEQASQIVTFALLAIGGLLLVQLVRR